jgi:hypothetical protein
MHGGEGLKGLDDADARGDRLRVTDTPVPTPSRRSRYRKVARQGKSMLPVDGPRGHGGTHHDFQTSDVAGPCPCVVSQYGDFNEGTLTL